MTRIMLCLILALSSFQPAFAHHWYDVDCCDKDDCRAARPGELRWTPEGWLHVPTSSLIPEDRVRSIPEHAPAGDKLQMHVCETKYGLFEDGVQIVPKGGLRCLYQGELGT